MLPTCPSSWSTLSQLLMSEFRQTDPDFSVLDLKAYYRGCKYATELIKMLPQKPDPIFIAQLFQKIIHPEMGSWCIVECVAGDGSTIWLADFMTNELELVEAAK
jgi:hypothetical protein